MKRTFLHGLMAAVLTAAAAITYNNIYCAMLLVDFTTVINPLSIIAASLFGCLFASMAYYFLLKWLKANAEAWFNALFLVLTFASLISSFSVTLPLTVESPELFVGLSVPMHLFPCLFWLALRPLFYLKKI